MVEGRGQDQTAPGTSSEPEFRYVVPRWFLDNSQTADELKNAQAKIWLTDEAIDAVEDPGMVEATAGEKLLPESAGDGRDSYFSVAREAVEDLLDAVASLQTVDLAGRLSLFQSSITLSCEMRFGLQFFDELVILTAKELGSSLVSINSQDLEDIGLDFYYQKERRDDSDNNSDSSDSDYDTPNITQKAAQRYFRI
ncbi:hypothetical protein CTA2_2864 [Colletotrichum tanaceti]|uniref:Uncharacterized protein n=1 Tax=Colletotrichum tanaceti TaxID=1306861 RepID=A0A4U6X1N9_9PEZI|nr:hypothetical protein CTA2_2864 [Colletotrichum tanaceti]TKW49281.1 hypothetical protein CTA1_548 [Colletotrichum tanaceti]